MKQRNIWIMLLLDFVTLGFYQLFWTKWTRDELVARGQKVPRFIWLLAPFLAMLVLMLAGVILIAASGDPNSADSGYTSTTYNNDFGSGEETGGTALSVAFILGLVAGWVAMFAVFIWWFHHYSKAVEAVTKGQTSYGLAYGLWFVLYFFGVGFIWPLIIQDGFNKVEGATPTTGGPAPGQIPDTPYPSIGQHQA